MQVPTPPIGVELTSVAIVVWVLLFACLIALAPLRRLRLPFTVAIMLLGVIIGIAVENLEHAGYGQGGLKAIYLESVALPGEAISDPETTGSRDHTRDENAQGERRSTQTTLLRKLLDEFVMIFRAAGDGLSPFLILFVFLPILIFESAYNMETRKVIKNFLPIMVLAVPGLLLSTAICGGALILAGGEDYSITWSVALLFGVIMSATDPVAVVALFKELGAPKRLSLLVEGESLFNDGTAIVLFNILLAIVLSTTTTESSVTTQLTSGVLEFLKTVAGGALVGFLLAWTGWKVIGSIIENLPVKVSLTIIMAYASFIVAEHIFHVSGVIAVVIAGLASSSYSQVKLSNTMSQFMKEFWEFLAFAANSLIFFLVGLVIVLRVDFENIVAYLPLLGVVILALTIARAISIFGSMPLLRRLVKSVDIRYQTVLFWGGLRGAVGLALALTVLTTDGISPEVQQAVLTLTAGVVLFTLLVNALTIEPLLVMLGLNKPSIMDRFTMEHAELVVCDNVLKILHRMEEEELMTPSIIAEFRDEYRAREKGACKHLAELRKEADEEPRYKKAVAGLLALAVEKREVLARFSDGSISESAARSLLGSADRLMDIVKSGDPLPEIRQLENGVSSFSDRLLAFLDSVSMLKGVSRLLRSRQLTEEIQMEHALYIAARGVDRNLARMEDARTIDLRMLARVQARFFSWEIKAMQKLTQLAEEHPDHVKSVQKVLAEMEVIHCEAESLLHLKEIGLLTEKAWTKSLEEIIRRKRILAHKL